MWLPIIVLVAQLASAPAPVQAAYQKLTPAELEAKKVTHATRPPKDAHKIDVSARIRSASFGHKTWLIVAADGKQFWVEYGASTNRPGATYGPFAVASAATAAPAPAATTTTPPANPPPSTTPPSTTPPPPTKK